MALPRVRWIIAAVIALSILAWGGWLDGLSADYLDGALLGSGAIYATARGINALVSVLQGTEMNAFLVTFSVGELLDPVNDLVERFSAVIMIAIASLALQKIMLGIVTHQTFNILLTSLGIAAAACGLWGTPGWYGKIARFFLVSVLLRFSLSLVVLANGWADAIFLQESQARGHEAMQGFSAELGLISSRIGLDIDLKSDMQQVKADIARNQQEQEAKRRTIAATGHRLQAAQSELDTLDQRSWWEKITGATPAAVEDKIAEIRSLQESIERDEYTLAALDQNEEALRDRLRCLEKRSRGEGCSLADNLSNTLAALDFKQRIDALGGQVTAFASNLINLLMLLILKSVLLPLFFFYLLFHSVKKAFAGH